MVSFLPCYTVTTDATNKLNWMGFPVIVMGTVDRNIKCHLMVYACTSNETADHHAFVFWSVKDGFTKYCPGSNFALHILIADGADSIKNAFFRSIKKVPNLILCALHMLLEMCERDHSHIRMTNY